MKITKSSIMHAILTSGEYTETIKVLTPHVLGVIRDTYGEGAVQRIRDSSLYELEAYAEDLYLRACNLSANVFEQIPNVIAEEELTEIFAAYMKENGMWPTEKPIHVLVRYSIDVALPLFVKAGLLEVV